MSINNRIMSILNWFVLIVAHVVTITHVTQIADIISYKLTTNCCKLIKFIDNVVKHDLNIFW